ncbi:MAG TPA: hypothetical protein PLU72_08305 [Candidatus Ozemobacteraceae bacterium]|nr:hypothetical protein [Candidatus Ozemobacteraceae bacterium]
MRERTPSISCNRGYILAAILFLILVSASIAPLLLHDAQTIPKRPQTFEEMFRIHWALEGANQWQLHEANINVVEPFCGFVNSVATFSYPDGFKVRVDLLEGRTMLARNRFLKASAKAYHGNVAADYDFSRLSSAPAAIPGVTAGGAHSFGWKANGSLLAWGLNTNGRLGTNDTAQRATPTPVNKGDCLDVGTDFSQGWNVAAGGDHSLVLDMHGNAWAFGNNAYGQLGSGNTTAYYAPHAVTNGSDHLSNVSDIAAGTSFSLAIIRPNGNVLAWGLNSNGQLGNTYPKPWLGTPSNSSVPVTVRTSQSSIIGIVGIAAGREHALAIDKTGHIYAWGNNANGQIGFDAGNYSPFAVTVNSGEISEIASSPFTTTARTNPGTTQVYIPSRFGISSITVELNVAIPWNLWGVSSYAKFQHLSISTYSVNVIFSSYTNPSSNRYIWKFDQIESETTYEFQYPGTYTLTVQAPSSWLSTSASNANGKWFYTSSPAKIGVHTLRGYPKLPTAYIGVAAGDYHSIAVASESNTTSLLAWGLNSSGQLGLGDTVSRDRPVPVPNCSNVRRVVCGAYHTLALKNDGTVWAWGDNSYGQLGIGSTVSKSVPTRITSLTDIVGIAAGSYHSLAISANGTVYSWGRGDNGRLGTGAVSGNQTSPAIVTGFP